MTEPAHPAATRGQPLANDSGGPVAAAADGRAPSADRQVSQSWLPLLGSAGLAAALLGLLLIAKYAT